MKTCIIAVLLLLLSSHVYSASREFCFRAYSTGITSLKITDNGTNETATFSDSHIIQTAMTTDVVTISGNNKRFSVITNNTLSYDAGGLRIRFKYEDFVTHLRGDYELSIDSLNAVVAGGPFEAYSKNSPECIRPKAPVNVPGRFLTSTVEVDPQKIQSISRYNAGYGHSYAPDASCHTQKHVYHAVKEDDDSIVLRLPDTAAGTRWRVWSWIWEDEPEDISISYQNVDAPWLFLKVHHVFANPPAINTVIAGGQDIGIARHGTSDTSAFNVSIEYIDANGDFKMTSIFELYTNQAISNAYPGLVSNGRVDRSLIILPDDYHWQYVERFNTGLNRNRQVDFSSANANPSNTQAALPDISHIPRVQRCLGHYPARVDAIFPNALADNYVMHIDELSNYLVPAPGPVATACSHFGLVEVDTNTPGYCNIAEHPDSSIVPVR